MLSRISKSLHHNPDLLNQLNINYDDLHYNNKGSSRLLSFHIHTSADTKKITSLLEYDPVIEKKTRWSSFDRIYSFSCTPSITLEAE